VSYRHNSVPRIFQIICRSRRFLRYSADAHSVDPAFSDHDHRLESFDGPPRRLETKETESGIDSPFDEPMVLLDEVVEVFTLSQLSAVGEDSFLL
jgi:hypothetical protein